jgi:hypothetical protein
MKERYVKYMPLLCIAVCILLFVAVLFMMERVIGIPYFIGGSIFGWYLRKWVQDYKDLSKQDRDPLENRRHTDSERSGAVVQHQ